MQRLVSVLGPLTIVLALVHPGFAQTCGDGARTGGEECDDANTSGGDGCAGNCTAERDLTCALAPGSTSTVQTVFSLPTALTGQVVLTVGGVRSDLPAAPVPFVIPVARGFIAPVVLPGLATSCSGLEELPEWGPGNAGGGLIDCGATRLADIDVSVTLAHDDPPPTPLLERSGMGPAGSVAFELGMTSYALLISVPGCVSIPDSGPPALGADAIPCTSDDPSRGATRLAYGSTGQASARVLNPNGEPGMIETTTNGQPLDCAQLDGAASLTGATLVAVTSALNLPQLGDATITVTLVCGLAAPVATPTRHIIATCAPTSTPTPTPRLGGTATPPPTPTVAVATATSAPTAPTSSPTAADTPVAVTVTPTGTTSTCLGDCNGDGTVTIDELVRAVNIALGTTALAQCSGVDGNRDGSVAIDELIRAVTHAVQRCPS